MSIIMFDTNAYRELAYSLKGKSQDEADAWIATLNNIEQQAGHTKELNFWVVCELLKHLEKEDDPAYTNCFHALGIALHHCTHMNILKLSKPFESDIADYFKIEASRLYYHALYMQVIDLAKQIIEKGRTEEFERLIPAVGQYITDTQDMLISGFINAKAELIKDAEFNKLKAVGFMDEYAFKVIATAIVKSISKIEPLSNADVDHFLDAFYYGVARVCRIIDKTPTTEDFKNHVIDAEICLRIGKSDGRVIISNDGNGKKEGLLNTFQAIGAYPDKAMTTVDYYKSLDFDISTPQEAVLV